MFILFIALYALVCKRKTQMMLYVAAFGLLFYYLNNGFMFCLLLFTAFYDFIIARKIYKSSDPKKKKLWLTLSICLSLSILCYFKYTNFFISMLSSNFAPLDIFLPAGISFYTFQTISYAVDVYKGKVEPARSFLQYLFYISFFPLILAGPIMRAGKFFAQIKDNKVIDKTMIYGGLWLIITGLLKKAVFADYIAQYNNWVFDAPLNYSGFEGLMAILGYTAQIYCDFSGYSDISIGMASIMGFDLGVNFRLPYQSVNLTEFWRRWHISLSSWMRDYIYIPLGGNRKSKFRMYVNNMITMLIAGLWHGASWQFIYWGGMHGVGLIVHKLNKPWLDKIPDTWTVKAVSTVLTFVFVAFLWIFFRASTMENALDLIKHTVSDFDIAYIVPFFKARTMWCVFIILIYLLHGLRETFLVKVKMAFISSHWTVKALIFLIIVQLIIQFDSGEIQPFIYYSF
jgi:D-alanyl-lipoteichoic acid acyltransferase DltB (MBOAT superfamily)